MDKLHICHLLLLLVTWISLSSQRPAPEPSSDNLLGSNPNLEDPSMWIADYGYHPTPNADPKANHNHLDDIWTSTAWMRTQHQHRKRGFSMLTRWKPFNSLGKQRASIRNINRGLVAPPAAANDFEMVSAETRAFSRPSGQPLRWG